MLRGSHPSPSHIARPPTPGAGKLGRYARGPVQQHGARGARLFSAFTYYRVAPLSYLAGTKPPRLPRAPATPRHFRRRGQRTGRLLLQAHRTGCSAQDSAGDEEYYCRAGAFADADVQKAQREVQEYVVRFKLSTRKRPAGSAHVFIAVLWQWPEL